MLRAVVTVSSSGEGVARKVPACLKSKVCAVLWLRKDATGPGACRGVGSAAGETERRDSGPFPSIASLPSSLPHPRALYSWQKTTKSCVFVLYI